jgi:5'-nucleotidase
MKERNCLNILLANDDGIDSNGLRVLAEALASEHDVYVCAPDGQRSGTGHSLTILEPVTVDEYDLPPARMAYRIGGTPADCVKMGIGLFADEGIEIDIVYSGINNGSNIGTDTLYSGTVSAALEGSVCGLPAVAVSVNSLTPQHYELALELALRAARLDFAAIDPKLVLNINTPDLPKAEIKGVKIAELGLRGYYDWNIKSRDADGRMTVRYYGDPIEYAELDEDANDVGASQRGYATITPIHFDLTSYGLLDKVRASGIAES